MTMIRETYVERRQPAIRWGAVIAGGFAALGIALLLEMLVVGGDLASTDVHRADSWRGLAGGSGIWSVIAVIVALFLGGLVAGRLAHVRDRGVTALHGGVMWALVMVFGTLLAVWTVSSIAAASEPLPDQTAYGLSGGTLGALGVDTAELSHALAPRLHANGRVVSPEQIDLALRDQIDDALRTGRLDRDAIAAALSERALLSRTDAQAVAAWIDTHHAVGTERIEDAGARTRKDVGESLLWLALAMALGLAASIAGGALGAPMPLPRRRGGGGVDLGVDDRRVRTSTTTLTGAPPPPVSPPPGVPMSGGGI